MVRSPLIGIIRQIPSCLPTIASLEIWIDTQLWMEHPFPRLESLAAMGLDARLTELDEILMNPAALPSLRHVHWRISVGNVKGPPGLPTPGHEVSFPERMPRLRDAGILSIGPESIFPLREATFAYL
ncbi:hypothetical protein B0H19DRAFT_1187042 [Mycena capillaripes]|nr:hypothetical protein B0H19DRAFT_1186956 [Mycena capillaripes]KAJ6533122.1 hypothetical protein B0H19DRAFT_1187042 [Mycena capillaripes]